MSVPAQSKSLFILTLESIACISKEAILGWNLGVEQQTVTGTRTGLDQDLDPEHAHIQVFIHEPYLGKRPQQN